MQLPLQLYQVPQAVQATPPLPHLDAEVPGWQEPPSQHPLQQLPPRQRPPEQAVPSETLDKLQLPVLQLALLQGLELEQVPQAAPPVPQWLELVPG